MSVRRAPDPITLRKAAESLARSRGESPTTAHVLAAISRSSGPGAHLLSERRLSEETLLRAIRVAVDDTADAVARAFQRAQEVAARTPLHAACDLHLLFALCHDSTTAAHRVIAQCGVDVAKLRAAAMQRLLGAAEPRRIATSEHARALSPTARSGFSLPGPTRFASPTVPRLPAAKAAAPKSQPGRRRARDPLPIAPAPQGPSSARTNAPTAASALATAHGAVAGSAAADAAAVQGPPSGSLAALGRDLTTLARANRLDPVVGREHELDRVLDVFGQRDCPYPLIVGPSGVGKTSLVRALTAYLLEREPLAHVWEVDGMTLLAGTALRGALSERIQSAFQGAASGEHVLFFDDIDRLLATDVSEEAATTLARALSERRVRALAATTPEGLRRLQADAPSLLRRFTVVELTELGLGETRDALDVWLPALEAFHGKAFDRGAVERTLGWCARYLGERPFPEKAIRTLDLAAARARRRALQSVDEVCMAEVVAESTGVPRERLLQTDADRMLRLEETFQRRIVGHRDALGRIARVVRRAASGFGAGRPMGSFLLLGPTGVGKTETAKAIAEALFDSPHALTRFDFSEFAEAHAVARLVGSPPGYVGHDAGGQLTEAVRKRPYQVLLFDEIEKAHRDVLEALLQVLDEGRMTDGRGRTVDFCHTVIVLTSNLGSEVTPKAARRSGIGFGAPGRDGSTTAGEDTFSAYQSAVVAAARSALPPELFNRFDEVIPFEPLKRTDVGEVATRMLRTLADDLRASQGVDLTVDASVVEYLLDKGGFDPEMGARPMRRALARHVEARLADLFLAGTLVRGSRAWLGVERGSLILRPTTNQPPSRTPSSESARR